MVDTRRARPAEPGQGPVLPGPGRTRTVFSLSDDETFDLGRSLGRSLHGGELILLEGDLGLGKTTFTKGLAAGIGIDPDTVSSPSFTLVHEYRDGRLPMFHVDLYRLEQPDDEMGTLGIEEILAAGGVVVVEWGERLPPYLRRGALRVKLHDLGEGSRRIEIIAEGRPAAKPRGDA